MDKFPWANTNSLDEAKFVILGVPDDSGSHSKRKGASQAPASIRKMACEREVFERAGVTSISLPQFREVDKKIFDYGDIDRSDVGGVVENLVRQGKVPITMGGDHSITAEVLGGIDRVMGVSIVYFDAHPDFICSTREYYGSVVCDISNYKNVKFSSSIEVGVRSPEPEELINLRREKLKTIRPLELEERGIGYALNEIKRRARGGIYISFDMDVVDPAFAPGVSVPVPGGLSSSQALYLVEKISGLGLVGMDVMEVCPPFDLQGITSHLAARLMMIAIGGA
jgi:agmatinase